MELLLRSLTLTLVIAVSLQRTVVLLNDVKIDAPRYNNPRVIDDKSDENAALLITNGHSANCSCESRYNVYYEAKGCRPAHYDACGCPIKYICEDANEVEEDNKVCHYKGRTYAPGTQIDTNNPCQRCQCMLEPAVMILCTLENCFRPLDDNPENCYDIYEKDTCCPVNNICIDEGEGGSEETSGTTCERDDRIYPLGARMSSKDDPCEVCMCTEDWINSNGSNSDCFQTHCVLEKYRSQLLKGCVPVYQEDTCCPIDFYCAPDEEFFHDARTVEPDLDLKCNFFGKNYHVGDSVSISRENNGCLSCTCQIPPDLTCIQQTCEPSPSEDSCYPYYTSGNGCCPQYECLMNDGNSMSSRSEPLTKREMEDESYFNSDRNIETSCADIRCRKGSVCMQYLVNCGNRSCPSLPTCVKTNSSCSTPLCGDGCVVTELDDNHCPTCVCADDIARRSQRLTCEMPFCAGLNCHFESGRNGCPVCSCPNPCPVPECQPGCNVVTVNEGRCPKCVCEDETEGCPTPLCAHEGCRIENGTSGCPTCVCENENSERELEDNIAVGQNTNSNPEQQQQQQQQQIAQGSVDLEGSYPPEPISETSSDYDDTIVFMSGSTLPRSSNMEETPIFGQNYDDSIESRELTNLIPETFSNELRSAQTGSAEPASAPKHTRGHTPNRARPEP